MNKTKIKYQINSVNLTGNLAKDAFDTDKATMIRMALWNGNDQEGNERPATFVNVMLVNCDDSKELVKGTRVSIKGRLANYKGKEDKWSSTGVIGYSFTIIKKEESSSSSETKEKLEDINKTKDVPWEIDL